MRRNDDSREQIGISYQTSSGMHGGDDGREPYFIKKQVVFTTCFFVFLHFEILPQIYPFYRIIGGDFLGSAMF